MIDVPVSSVMTDDGLRVAPDTSAVEAAQFLRKPDVQTLIVCDAEGEVVGVVTESDIVAVVAERGGNPRVDSFMSTPVVTTSPAVPLGLAADCMQDAGVRTLPVLDDGTYEGIVTREALAPYLSRNRLAIDWDSDPLSLDGTAPSDAPLTE